MFISPILFYLVTVRMADNRHKGHDRRAKLDRQGSPAERFYGYVTWLFSRDSYLNGVRLANGCPGPQGDLEFRGRWSLWNEVRNVALNADPAASLSPPSEYRKDQCGYSEQDRD